MESAPLASRLTGKVVGKWFVKEKRIKDAIDNSGAFSSGYTVENDAGDLAFMKSFNYVYAFKIAGGSADALKFMLDNYTYERDLLEFCSEHKMRRIVTAIDSGEYMEPGELIPVPYLVFELAQGNLPKYQEMKHPDLFWKLKAFHGALVGLSQLHKAKIAHQDIKPSNILIFGNEVSKIADLGCATQIGNESEWNGGDQRYLPVELHYRYISPDWETRRFGADFFMIGGLLTYLLVGLNFLAIMMGKVPHDLQPFKFGGSFEQAKSYLLKAYYEAIEEIEEIIHPGIKDEVVEILKEMVNPIPENRGNSQSLTIVKHRQFSLEKYISIVDRISKKVFWGKI